MEDIEKLLREIGSLIAGVLPKEYGFAFFIFNFGDRGNMFYISNAKREDMRAALQEFLQVIEERNEENSANP